jgi:hypothetical protein
MALMYLYDTTTYACRGVYEGTSAPAGTADAGVTFTDGRMEWAGGTGPWTLPTAVKEADERDWRDSELKDTDHWGLSDRTMSAGMTTYRQELRDMPTLTGFPDTHTRPTRPAGE